MNMRMKSTTLPGSIAGRIRAAAALPVTLCLTAIFLSACGSEPSTELTLERRRDLPDGFLSAGRFANGEAIYCRVPAAGSATRQITDALARLTTYFDESLASLDGFRDRDDLLAEITFTGSRDGETISGIARAVITGGEGIVGIAFDRSGQMQASAKHLLALLEEAAPTSRDEARPRRDLAWRAVRFPDGSGSIRLPKGWRITSSHQGAVDIAGPMGTYLSLGIGVPVATPEAAMNPLTGQPMPGAIIGYRGDPVSSLHVIAPQVSAQVALMNPGSPVIRELRVIESAPAQSATNGQAAYVLWETMVGREPYRMFSLIDCSPNSSGWWTFYYSTFSAPRSRFDQKLPVMMEIWQNGWRIDPAVFKRRLQRAYATMQETHRIMNEAVAVRSRGHDNALADWTEVFRGERMVRDTRTGEERFTNIGWVDQTVQRLNERAGYERFEQIPLRNFNR